MAKRKVKLETGKFYYAYGGIKHPAQIYEKDRKHGTYRAIKTGTTPSKDMVKKNHSKRSRILIHKQKAF